MSEGLYLQALEVFSKKEKKMSLDAFSRPELFDYKSLCDGYSHLLLSWEKREPLGVIYQRQAVDLLMRVNDGADWMFPLTSHFWMPTLFSWSIYIFCNKHVIILLGILFLFVL